MSEGQPQLLNELSDNAISDFDNELPVHPETTSQIIPVQQRTFNSFDEADAVADAEKSAISNAYGADFTGKKSAFRGTNSRKVDDSFARVTWTDLAKGRGNDVKKPDSRPMSAEKKGGLKPTPSIVEFNLEERR